MSSPKVYTHSSDSPLLHRVLKHCLPYCVPLYYRIQHKNNTPHARILATFPPSENENAIIPTHFAAVYLDRSRRPETEMWAFVSGEMPDHVHESVPNASSSAPNGAVNSENTLCPTCASHFLSMISYISTLPIPPMDPANEHYLNSALEHEKQHPDLSTLSTLPRTSGSFVRHLLIPSIVTFGTVHSSLGALSLERGLLRPEFPGLESPLNKFIFRIADLPATRDLPEGLSWGEIRSQDIEIVQARTTIPRSRSTLLTLKSVGVFEEKTDKPIAWTFLGLDGSLATLHTEPEFRGRGIAKAVAAKCFREYVPQIAKDEHGDAWGHADVYKGNVQSEGVCKSLGGRALWTNFWVRLDVDRAKGF